MNHSAESNRKGLLCRKKEIMVTFESHYQPSLVRKCINYVGRMCVFTFYITYNACCVHEGSVLHKKCILSRSIFCRLHARPNESEKQKTSGLGSKRRRAKCVAEQTSRKLNAADSGVRQAGRTCAILYGGLNNPCASVCAPTEMKMLLKSQRCAVRTHWRHELAFVA